MSYISEKNSQVTIWSVVLFGIICRIIYSRSYADELDPESKRLPIKIMFTQIRFVNQWMLFWSLLTGQVVWAYLRYSMNATYAQKFNQKVVYKWTLSFLLFSIYYWGFRLTTGTGQNDFDPSGHCTCALVSSMCHI